MRTFFLLLALSSLNILTAQNSLTGTVTDISGQPVDNARITMFSSDTTLFWETRTGANGIYWIENIPTTGFYWFFGVAKPGYEYFQNNTTIIVDTIVHNVVLQPETNTGEWTTYVDAPEPLGGTDLGILLPDGRTYYCHDTKDPFAFSPLLNDTMSMPGSTVVQGCVAPKLMWDGNLIMVGGTDQEIYGPGTRKVKQFNVFSQTWQPRPQMLDYRWYPSMTQLANGKLLVVGGGGLNNPVRVNTSELYDPVTGTSQWVDTIALGNEQSPILTLYNGKALMTFRPPQLFDPQTNQWDLAADFVQGNRMPNGDHVDHELVHLPEGEVISVGYKPFPAGSGGNLVERYDPESNSWTLGAHFAPLRSRAETVLLPDRNILVIAGAKEDPLDPSPVNQWGYLDLTDLYNPYTESWRRLAPMPRQREYHALAILLADGRVVVTGGEGAPGNEPPKSVIDVFEPPYLFRGVRPQILNLEKTTYQRGERIRFDIVRTNAPTAIVLQSVQSVTHMMNCGENRFLNLDYSQDGQAVEAYIPGDSLHVLPGWYLLFAMVDNIPSEGKIVQIKPGQPATVTVNSVQELSNISLFPNPVQSVLTLQGDFSKYEFPIIIRMTDPSGKIVQTWQFGPEQLHSGINALLLDKLKPGIYFMKIGNGEKTSVHKLIKL